MMRQIFPDQERQPGTAPGSFQDLMQWRVRRVLLVSSLYDSFMFAEDRLADALVLGEFLGVELSTLPEIHRVSTAAEALDEVKRKADYDLVISSPQVGGMHAQELARGLRKAGIEVPIIMLAYHERELKNFIRAHGLADIDRAFLFQGDIQLFLAIVKWAEDLMNIQHDVDTMGVQVILVIEDNIRYYSYFLPVIYTAVLQNTASLVPDGINLAHKLLRVKARPKIVLASDYERAWSYFQTYEANILGVISDVEFPKEGKLCPDAGVQFAREVLQRHSDVPVVLDSGRRENAALAEEAGTSFLHKYSPTLLQELSRFMGRNFGFGHFVFRMPDGTEVARARDLRQLERTLHTVPGESIWNHAKHNDFSTWLKAHTEFDIAYRFRPLRISEFEGAESLRRFLIDSIRSHREERRRAAVADFEAGRFNPERSFARIGGGALGGKARGLAFTRRMLKDFGGEDRFDDVRIAVPPSVIIGTDVFDEFLDANGLRDYALRAEDDEEIEARFEAAAFPLRIQRDLRSYLELADYPLAVRSSSLLEDAKYQPFAGVYDTLMIANDHPDVNVRLPRLVQAVKRVYASTFSQRAKRYVGTTTYRLEGEKMAVIVQRVVGAVHGDRFYPELAGVALSQNFYPVEPVKAEDGLAAVALGLGREVAAGGICLRFSPRHPDRILQMSSADDALRNSQRQFFALSVDKTDRALEAEIGRYDLSVAEEDGTLAAVGSTYSPENDVIYDSVSRPGTRLVTLAPILKHGLFPLASILSDLLELGTYGAGGAVEIEFAVNLSTPPGTPKEFGFLQLRPVVPALDPIGADVSGYDPAELVCQSNSVLGSGRLGDIHDFVVVDADAFERGQSRLVATQVAAFNARLCADKTGYALVGVGRWGSADPLLGIPVSWDQISGAQVIVEAGFRDMAVAPSQGTHFFQNLVANDVGYFTVNPEAGEGLVDWEWLRSCPAKGETPFVRHIRLDAPVTVLMSGARHEGVILKPGVARST
ncbi:MAG TPA: PEP/pyruvate-binding domain-containing protein [Acidobacteriota bacterium]|nr:PEP/pyruvate-binding domain-containing protein [Acidobacteriota bacterium]